MYSGFWEFSGKNDRCNRWLLRFQGGIVSFRHLVQQPTRKVKIRLLFLALLFVVMQTAPWLVSKIMHPEGAEREVFMRCIRVAQMIGMVSQWTKAYAGCRVFIDLLSIYRWKKQQV